MAHACFELGTLCLSAQCKCFGFAAALLHVASLFPGNPAKEGRLADGKALFAFGGYVIRSIKALVTLVK